MPHDHIQCLINGLIKNLNPPNEIYPSQDIPTVSTSTNSSIECLIKFIALKINKVDKLLKDIKSAVNGNGNGNGSSNGSSNGDENNPWSALGNGTSGYVNSIALDTNGNIYAGGTFIRAGQVTVNNIALWDITLETWSALETLEGIKGINGTVNAIAIDKTTGNIYAGGYFTQAGGVTVNNIALWDPTLKKWSALQTLDGTKGINGTVNAIAIDKNTGYVYVGGTFTRAGDVTVNNIALWDQTLEKWSALEKGINGVVNAISIDSNSNVYAGGTFTKASENVVNNIAMWNLTSNKWSTLQSSDGSIGANNTVYAITVDSNNNVYVGGVFTEAGGVKLFCIALWNPSLKVWSDIGFDSQGILLQGTYISTIAIDNSTNIIYVGGNIKPVGEFTDSQYIAKLDINSGIWDQLTTGCNNYVNTITTDLNNRIYVGGLFTESGDIPTNYISTYSYSF
jgi:hypothetical protein